MNSLFDVLAVVLAVAQGVLIAWLLIDKKKHSKTIAQITDGYASMRDENITLRAMMYRLMPCHHCGATTIHKCPSGFPGCALADDLVVHESLSGKVIRELRQQLRYQDHWLMKRLLRWFKP